MGYKPKRLRDVRASYKEGCLLRNYFHLVDAIMHEKYSFNTSIECLLDDYERFHTKVFVRHEKAMKIVKEEKA